MKVIIDMPDYGSVDNILKACENAQPLSTELEKIKAEIEERISHCDSDYDFEECLGLREAIEIIDKHISELKGENK